METTQTEFTPTTPSADEGIILSPEAQFYLQKAGKWASFIGIIGFIFCGLFFIMALFIGSIFGFLAKMSPTPGSAAFASVGPMLSVVYIIIDVIYFMLVLYLYQFAVKAKRGIAFGDSHMVTQSLSKLKSFFKTWGIITIVFLSIYVLAFVIMVVAGIGAASMMR